MAPIYLNLSWLAGIFVASLTDLPHQAALLLAIAIYALLWGVRKCGGSIAILGVIIFALGIFRFDAVVAANVDELWRWADADQVLIRGTIVSEPDVRERHTSFVLSVEEVATSRSWTAASGKVLVQARRNAARVYGERLELAGRLEEPTNFGSFDYKAFLARQGIYYVLRYPRIVRVDPPATLDLLGISFAIKQALSQSIDEALHEPQSSLAKGIVFGIRSSLPDELRADFARTNTSHILAVSGWNISLVAGLLLLFSRRLLGRFGQTLVVVIGIAGYALLIGPQPSVLRAALMGSMLLVGGYFGRSRDTLVALLFAATMMTAYNPSYLWDVGFQLSFAATAGIALLTASLQRQLGCLPPLLADAIATTAAAQLATLPITTVVFGEFSVIAIVANLLIAPALLPIMLLGALTAFAGLLSQTAGQLAGVATWPFLTWVVRIVDYFASLPLASISVGGIVPLLAIPYYALIASLFAGGRSVSIAKPPAAAGISALTRMGLGFLALSGVLAWSAFFSLHDELRITFLDVGQGDAVLITLPNGRRALVDGGPSPVRLLEALGQRMPFYDKRVDLAILTHPNEDHLSGLVDAIERLDVRRVLESNVKADTQTYQYWRQLVQDKGIEKIVASAGQEIRLSKGVSIQILYPFDGALSGNDVNDVSVILKLKAHNTSVLLMGDAGIRPQQALLRAGVDLAASILKVPHHGAQNSLDATFLDAVNPTVAVISVGEDNRFGHPAEETLRLLEGRHVFRTDRDGSVEIVIDDQGFQVRLIP